MRYTFFLCKEPAAKGGTNDWGKRLLIKGGRFFIHLQVYKIDEKRVRILYISSIEKVRPQVYNVSIKQRKGTTKSRTVTGNDNGKINRKN